MIIKNYNPFLNLKISNKLILGFIVIIFLGIVTSIINWSLLASQSNSYIISKQVGRLTADLRLIRQEEKNYILRNDTTYANKVKFSITDLQNSVVDISNNTNSENKKYLSEISKELNLYKIHFIKYLSLSESKHIALKEMIKQGREVEILSDRIRADQKEELEKLEEITNSSISIMRDKRIKADDANRMIKLMDEARQSEKNFLLRKDTNDSVTTIKLIHDLIKQAEITRERFSDSKNREMATSIITAAKKYTNEFLDVIDIIDEQPRDDKAELKEQKALNEMVKQGREVEILSDRIRADQKEELEKLEKTTNLAIVEMRDKRIKADDANRMIKLMDEARQSEKNFLIKENIKDAELTTNFVNKLIIQAKITLNRFSDLQNRAMAKAIIIASIKYDHEFKDVIKIVEKQNVAEKLMIDKARQVEKSVTTIETTQFKSIQESIYTTRVVSLFAELLKIAVFIFLAWLIFSSISKPIVHLSEILTSLAKDNTQIEISEQNRNDEVGLMGKAVQILKERLIERNRFQKEIILARNESEQTNIELKSVNAELESFAYSVSHDLRTPLRAINGYARILMEKYPNNFDEESSRIVDIMRINAIKMGDLIDALLTFSRLGRASLKYEDINMNKLVNEIIYELTIDKQKKINFIVSDLSSCIGDIQMIRQVWTNLISNAIKFSQYRDYAEISINSILEKKQIIYSIRDNGAGFNMKYSDKLFGVFQRLHSEKKFTGSGVGLALVQRIIHRHGGEIWAKGEVDVGAIFYFSLRNKNRS
ncbi:MAG: sensor histidine kinase [Stygiobacter sp.]|nr:MAG: sensor histidine kinase [Stygiobacter sp.]